MTNDETLSAIEILKGLCETLRDFEGEEALLEINVLLHQNGTGKEKLIEFDAQHYPELRDVLHARIKEWLISQITEVKKNLYGGI